MIEHVASLAVDDLELLVRELRAGRLARPFTSAGLARYLGSRFPAAESLGSTLQKLSEEGMTSGHIALLLELAAAERRRARPIEDALDLVTTGPEVSELASRDTSVVVRELCTNAREHLLVVGYAVHKGRSVFEALARRMEENPALEVTMCLDVQRPVGDTSLLSEIVAR